MTITIKAARDTEGGVWYIADSDLPGLNLEGEALMNFTTNYFTALRN